MIHKQQSLTLDSIICINVVINEQKIGSDSLIISNSSSNYSSISVKLSDPVSAIFNSVKLNDKITRIVFNGQTLCPLLSFSFYNIHNKDTLVIISSPITSATIKDLTANIPLKDANNHRILVASPCPFPISHKRTLFYSENSNKFRNFLNKDEASSKSITQMHCNDNSTENSLIEIPINSLPQSITDSEKVFIHQYQQNEIGIKQVEMASSNLLSEI